MNTEGIPVRFTAEKGKQAEQRQTGQTKAKLPCGKETKTLLELRHCQWQQTDKPHKSKAIMRQRDKDLTGVKALPVAVERQAAQRQSYHMVERQRPYQD